MNAVRRQLAAEARRRANLVAMDEAVGRWTTDAQGHPRGAALLQDKADWVERQLGILYRTAQRNAEPPVHLRGLTAWDLNVAHGQLQAAADRLRQAAA